MLLKEISPEMRERIIIMMSRTWDIIGQDVLEANDGKDMPRSHVIEVVLDADFCLTHGDDPEAYKVLKDFSYGDKIKIGKEAFLCSRYGL